ncbi:MAG: phytanoyl-CoA dioxygenase family protein, partial [Pseudomonadales bacterium]|nr:phytanoyl-CoA dioxygenase family protein [Pseudomonadales bacterium]
IMAAAGSGGEIGELPPAINLEAKAGTVMIFDGRLLHGTGANRTDKQRFVATMSNVKSWMRQQENWVVSVLPEVLEKASPKLLHRMGFQALTYGSTIEGFGLGAGGRIGDPFGNIRIFREACDRGEYIRVGKLTRESSEEELQRPYTVRQAWAAAREARKD